ncbi:DUF1298 domain-containing protein [Skermania sp. ID1734]|uniref:bifunctional phosphatase PAP2/O-acyltransferase family protein n=1 Tax=Skermania sp. ID1734 TaxID=2597516 RepID=UPI00117E902B|nr:phosphatase PAP2 family protein [Skermania sp. ID1734]TSE00325.1 DUF1298 domain-containing protein [Skermania sp. ID1734]
MVGANTALAQPNHVQPTSAATQPKLVLWRDVLVALVVFGFYAVVQTLGGAVRRAQADQHAADLIGIERTLHIDIERSLNDWLAGRGWLATAANYEYAFTYIASALILLVYLYTRRPDAYPRARDSLLLLNVLGIACFALYPVTPPRMLENLGYVDTVSNGHTWGSWGSPMVAHANQLAAMPSLHVAWALWVSVVLARIAGGLLFQFISAIHVLLTCYVIIATGNHFVLDAVGAVVFVAVSVWIVDRWYDWRASSASAISPADAFFLYVEDTGAPQHVGGMVVLRHHDPNSGPTLAAVRELVRNELSALPRFRQRVEFRSRWRRPRWVGIDEIDWDWHVIERDVGPQAGNPGLSAVVAELAAQPMPRDRPLWRIVLVHGIAPGQSGFLFLVHHAVADGIGTVLQSMRLLRPRITLGAPSEPGPPHGRLAMAARALKLDTAARALKLDTATRALKIAAAVAVGIGQLATDGSPARRLPASSRLRDFAVSPLELARLRAVARAHQVGVTDVLICLAVTAAVSVQPRLPELVGGTIRIAIPRMVRAATSEAEGNFTAAVMIDVELRDERIEDRLRRIHSSARQLQSPTRALAARFVMAQGQRILPEPAKRWFAQTVYGASTFHAIVSNMPGPNQQLTLVEEPMDQVYPILPLAPGAPLVAGALSWNGVLGVGVAADPVLLDAAKVASEIECALTELEATTGDWSGSSPFEREEQAGAESR